MFERQTRVGRPRPLAARLALAGLLLLIAFGGVRFASTMTNPAYDFRSDLIRAGSEMQRLPWSTPHQDVGRALSSAFGRSVTVDPTGFPAYARVTIDHVAKDACIETLRVARRIEGEVVIMLLDYRVPADCRDDNAMTWRLMP